MSSGGVPAVGPRIHRLATWFDPESAAVVTILLGLFQIMLAVPLAYAEETLPKFFILPLVLGILIVAGGSVTMANERNPSKLLLQGCACSNVVGLLGAMIAFCLYSYSLSNNDRRECVLVERHYWRRSSSYECPWKILAAFSWSVTLLLLLFDCGAMLLHSVLSVSALKALKTN